MPRSRRGSRSSASPSPTNEGGRWLNWQSVSDISMSDTGSYDLEYSESEDDVGMAVMASPKYATGSSLVLTNPQVSKSSRIVRFNSSPSDLSDDEEAPRNSKCKRSKLKSSTSKKLGHEQHHRVWNAVSNIAHSRSPKRNPSNKLRSKEHPHSAGQKSEKSPLLVSQETDVTSNVQGRPSSLREKRAILIAASFLTDCERGRRPSLPADLSQITDTILTLYKWKFSIAWQVLVHLAVVSLFFSSCIEVHSKEQAAGLNIYSIIIFVIDMAMGSELRKHQYYDYSSEDPVLTLRHSRMEKWTMPMMGMLLVLAMEMVLTVGNDNSSSFLWSAALKPIAIFYISTPAKNALEALNRIAQIVARVLVVELFLILSFAAVACQIYSSYESFQDLSTAFLSLFKLSTTVVNPSIWMPMYSASRWAATFFVLFVVTSVFYLHSLVLSVVFQSYVQASADIHDRSMTDREDSMRLAFLALESIPSTDEKAQVVQMAHVRKTLQRLRPHYNDLKIHALAEIVDPTNQQVIDYPSFRTKIQQALNASIRSTRTASIFSVIVELVASFVAVANCLYVILLSSSFNTEWFNAIIFPAGCVITGLGAFELVARFGHARIFQFTPISRLNTIFDGLAAVAAVISTQGIINFFLGRSLALELLLIGRAVDMIRVMRFFVIFRDVVRRSGDVFPALAGPLALVMSTVHLFTYLGMALWGGAITIGSYGDNIEPFYDLNNFNTYTEGLVTMFQVLVVNDWHAIAKVFLYATKCSSPYIVYPFFVVANLVCVSIMLNCLTAFFVGAFVTKLNDDMDAEAEVTSTGRALGFSLDHTQQNAQRITSQITDKAAKEDEEEEEGGEHEEDEQYEFDVYEREGYDKVMRTVAGGNDHHDEFARHICDVLELFEGLCSGRERVGYMVCCQQTLNRYGNRRFQSYAKNFIHENALHMVVSDMHAELILFGPRDKVLQREFKHLESSNKKLEITASLIRHQPVMSLFVSRIVYTVVK